MILVLLIDLLFMFFVETKWTCHIDFVVGESEMCWMSWNRKKITGRENVKPFFATFSILHPSGRHVNYYLTKSLRFTPLEKEQKFT